MFRNILLLLIQIVEVSQAQILIETHVVGRIGARRETVVVSGQPDVEILIVFFAGSLSIFVQPVDVGSIALEGESCVAPFGQVVEFIEGIPDKKRACLVLGVHKAGLVHKLILASFRGLAQEALLHNFIEGVDADRLCFVFDFVHIIKHILNGLVSILQDEEKVWGIVGCFGNVIESGERNRWGLVGSLESPGGKK